MNRAYGCLCADPGDVATLPPGVTGLQRGRAVAEFGGRKVRPVPGVYKKGGYIKGQQDHRSGS